MRMGRDSGSTRVRAWRGQPSVGQRGRCPCLPSRSSLPLLCLQPTRACSTRGRLLATLPCPTPRPVSPSQRSTGPAQHPSAHRPTRTCGTGRTARRAAAGSAATTAARACRSARAPTRWRGPSGQALPTPSAQAPQPEPSSSQTCAARGASAARRRATHSTLTRIASPHTVRECRR